MSRGRIGAGVGAAALVLVVAFYAARPAETATSARALARARYERGLDAYFEFRDSAAFVAMRAAWEADPTYLPPLLELGLSTDWRFANTPSERAAVEALAASDSPLAPCARIAIEISDVRPATDPHGCGELWTLFPRLPTRNEREALGITATLWTQYPESPGIALLHVGALTGARDTASLYAAIADLGSPGRARVRRLFDIPLHIELSHLEGRDESARRLEGELLRRAASEPDLLHVYQSVNGHQWPLDPGEEARLAHRDSLTEVLRSAFGEARTRFEPGRRISVAFARAEHDLAEGRLNESEAGFAEVLSTARSADLPRWEAWALLGLGRVQVKMGRAAEAEANLLEAKAKAAQGTDMSARYQVEHNLLHHYEALGSDSLARAAGRAFIAATEAAAATPVRMMAYRDFAWYLRRRGDLDESRKLFERMVEFIATLGDYQFYAGEYYELIGELDRAKAWYAAQGLQTQDHMRASEGLIRILEATGDTAEAIARARLHDARVTRQYPEYRPLLPGLLARSGRTDEARRAFDGARSALNASGALAGWARLTLEQARWESERERDRQAEVLADSAMVAAGAVGDFETETLARAVAALARVRRGGRAGELATLRRAVGDAERAGLPQLEFEVRLLEAMGLASARNRAAALRTLTRASDLQRRVAGSLAEDIDRAGYVAAQSRISDLAFRVLLDDAAGPTAAEWLEWSARRKEGLEEIHSPIRVDGLRSRLGTDRALIDYVATPEHVAALVLTDASAVVVRLPTHRARLAADLQTLYQGVAPTVGSYVDRSRARFDPALSAELYRALFAPLEEAIGSRVRVVIVPDGPLHYLPFDALVVGPSPATYLLQRYEVLLARSVRPAESAGRRPGILAVAGGAPRTTAAREELEAVAAVWEAAGGSGLPTTASDEGSVVRLARDFGVIHFAGHARPNALDPDLGFVSTAPGPGSDGRLHGYEIRALDLSGGTLVVLSACETAGGRLLAGQGVMSLARAFLLAGAGEVVGTLWPVGPSTQRLMTAFHAELAAGRRPSEALRTAKLALLRAPGGGPPFLWAPFVLITPGLTDS